MNSRISTLTTQLRKNRHAIYGGLSVCAVIVGLQIVQPYAHAAQAGPRTATSTSDCTATGTGDTAWSNTGNARTSDDAYANTTLGNQQVSNYLQCVNFGFSIPAGVTIDGVVVHIERKSDRTTNGGSQDSEVKLIKGGVIGATNRALTTTYTTSDVTVAYGSSSDLWGTTWTASDINAANFGVAFKAERASNGGTNHLVTVDAMTITVHYTMNTQIQQASYRWYENSVETVVSDNFTKLADPSSMPDNYVNSTAWSPDGQYLSVGVETYGGGQLIIYKRSGDSFTKLANPSTMPDGNVLSVAWSPDSQYLSVGSGDDMSANYLTIYKRSGDTFTKLDDPNSTPNNRVTTTAWSSDGQYLSIGSETTGPDRLTIYKRSGDTFTELFDPSTMPGNYIFTTAWSPDGQYLSVGSDTTGPDRLTIYKRSGDNFTKLADPSTMPGNSVRTTAWSPDGQYLSVGSSNTGGGQLSIYKRSGDNFTKLADPSTMPGNSVRTTAWSPDGQYLSVGSYGAGTDRLTIYKRSGDSFTKLADPSTMPGIYIQSTDWSPDGQYLSVGSHGAGTDRLIIYKRATSIDVLEPLAAQDSVATAPAPGTPFRLRLNLGISSGNLASGDYKLRYRHEPGGTCNAGASFSDITTSSPIKFYDNSTVSDKIGLTTNANDPTRSGITAVRQTYNETNPFSVTTNIPAGQDGIWDFALTFDSSANTAGAYCLKVTDSSNAGINTYTVMPKISAPVASYSQSSYRWYENADSTTPGTPLAAQDTAAQVAPDTPIRLRHLVRVDNNRYTSGDFRLEYAQKSGTCSASTYEQVSTKYSPTKSASYVASYGGGQVTWSYMGALGGPPDSVLAEVSLSGLSTADTNYLVPYSYSANVPTTATIDGIEAIFHNPSRSSSGIIAILKSVTLADLVNPYPGGKTGLSFSFSQSTLIAGSPTDLWGRSWTPAEVNNLGVYFQTTVVNNAGTPESFSLDSVQLRVYYTDATGKKFVTNDNPSVSDQSGISAHANDPTDSGRTVQPQTYSETGILTKSVSVSEVAPGSSMMWDSSIKATASASGTYCFRIAKSNGSLLDSYLQYPEISVNSGPNLDQQLRGGQSVINGQKKPFTW